MAVTLAKSPATPRSDFEQARDRYVAEINAMGREQAARNQAAALRRIRSTR